MYPSLSKYRNVFKGFREPSPYLQSSVYSKTFDEPTYLTFSVFFRLENVDTIYTGFDRFPMPLLNTYIEDSYDLRSQYSSINYLRDTNEFVRAELLNRFIEGLNHLQSYYQWYFQGIDGLNQIIDVVPERGQRVASDAMLTLNLLEGLDQKIFNLFNTYKQIAWDSKWQRWILPDMMRYFSLDIYVTEFRTFHRPNIETPGAGGPEGQNTNVILTILNMLENTMPTWKITCERCEFDIGSIISGLDSLSVAEAPEQKAMSVGIKVGNVHEEFINPVLDYYYNDKLLNGLDRSKEFTPGKTQSAQPDTGSTQTVIGTREGGGPDYDPTRVTTNPKVYANTSILAQGQLLAEPKHIPGTPFYEQTNNLNSIQQTLGGAPPPPGASLQPDFNPTNQSTWVGNAINLGTAFVQNFADSAIDKAKMTKIPGLGISVNEAISAIESKNFITVFGLVRQAMNRTFELSVQPSELLESGIVDGTMRQFLLGVSDSQATDESSIQLRQFADLALSDNGTFERIKDFSRATDLVGPKEINTPNPIEGASNQANIVAGAGTDRSLATDLDDKPKLEATAMVMEGVPSSQATINGIIQG